MKTSHYLAICTPQITQRLIKTIRVIRELRGYKFVGSDEWTDKNVGWSLWPEAFAPEPIFLYLVADDSFSTVEQFGCLGPITA